MSIDEEDLPDIIDIIDDDDDYDDEDAKDLQKLLKKVDRFARQHNVTARTFNKMRGKDLRELKKLIHEINMLLLAEARLKRDTYSGYIRKHEELRRRLLKSLLKPLCVDSRIYVLQEMLYDECGDDEPTWFYIG
jgi:F0F1-type ATP synthase beta subunit